LSLPPLSRIVIRYVRHETCDTGSKPRILFPYALLQLHCSPYNAATNAAPNPSNPPTPAITIGAAFELTGAGALLELLELLELVCEVLLDGALVVAATLVVTAVTLVVETGIEDVVVTVFDESAEVVVAEAEAREEEKAEQRPNPTEAATASSVWLHADSRHVATALWMAEMPVPHWQASSASWQPAIEIADVRQGMAHEGSPAKFCAETRLAVVRIAMSVVRILTVN